MAQAAAPAAQCGDSPIRADDGLVFTKPTGALLNESQARSLDDDFFGSRPMQYFHARIGGLLKSSGTGRAQPSVAQKAFEGLLGSVDDVLSHEDRDREMQLAVDAFATRHHAAEALTRLYHALTSAHGEGPRCVWAAIVDGPRSTSSMVESARMHLTTSPGCDTFATLVLPRHLSGSEIEPATQALNVAGAWLQRAMDLLMSGDIDLNAAHNKVKHGLAIRARDDLRVTFTTVPPNADGTVPLSALIGDKATGIFTRTTLQFLSRPPQDGPKNAHLEAATFQLVPETLLAEAWMMSTILGTLFHRAAVDHLERHPPSPHDRAEGADESGRHAPELGPQPRLPLGPTPRELVGNSIVGLRHPVTTRRDGTAGRGPAWVFEEEVYGLEVDVDGRQSATIVEG